MALDRSEKRSTNYRITDSEPSRPAPGHGVGARQRHVPGPAGGGGYLDICTLPKSEVEVEILKIAELREMGLRSVWIEIAELTGADAFIELWEKIDQAFTGFDNSSIAVPLPKFSRFERAQRNKLIQTLRREGKTDRQIQEILSSELDIDLHVESIARIGRSI